jgi:hypothetical protein
MFRQRTVERVDVTALVAHGSLVDPSPPLPRQPKRKQRLFNGPPPPIYRLTTARCTSISIPYPQARNYFRINTSEHRLHHCLILIFTTKQYNHKTHTVRLSTTPILYHANLY